MSTITKYTDKFEVYRLSEEATDSSVSVCPERGGIAIEFRSLGKDIFYLDKETFYSPETNIRGGNPILFPICGQLENTEYELNERIYKMKNHGLARSMKWNVIDHSIINGFPVLKTGIESNNETKKSFPFDFKVTFTYSLKNGALEIIQEYENTGSIERMPFHAGFHPYFQVENKNIFYTTSVEKCYDYNDSREKYFSSPFDLTDKKEAVVLEDDGSGHISFYEKDSCDCITLEYGPEFKYIMLWSAENKPFVCVEPWTAKTGEFHRKNELLWLSPGEKLTTWFKIKKDDLTRRNK